MQAEMKKNGKNKEEQNRVTKQQLQRYEYAKEKVIGKNRKRDSIGTLSEKTVHAVLKYYYDADKSHHEISLEGSVADVFDGSRVVEIQTKGFYKLKNKLERFLPLYPVTIVYPISCIKWVCWIDESTKKIVSKRKSPKKGNPYLVFKELYGIRQFLINNNLHIRIVMMDMEEYRLLNGWSTDKKRGSQRFDRYPLEIKDEVVLDDVRDYIQLLPLELPEIFTSANLAKTAKIPLALSQMTLLVMTEMGVVKRIGKDKKSFLYKIS